MNYRTGLRSPPSSATNFIEARSATVSCRHRFGVTLPVASAFSGLVMLAGRLTYEDFAIGGESSHGGVGAVVWAKSGSFVVTAISAGLGEAPQWGDRVRDAWAAAEEKRLPTRPATAPAQAAFLASFCEASLTSTFFGMDLAGFGIVTLSTPLTMAA